VVDLEEKGVYTNRIHLDVARRFRIGLLERFDPARLWQLENSSMPEYYTAKKYSIGAKGDTPSLPHRRIQCFQQPD
jgi:hypothetical protein